MKDGNIDKQESIHIVTQVLNSDLDNVDLTKLTAIKNEIDNAIETIAKNLLNNKIHELEDLAKILNVDVNSLMTNVKIKKSAVSGKVYVNPEDPSKVWAGKGKRPKWLTDELGKGRTLEELESL